MWGRRASWPVQGKTEGNRVHSFVMSGITLKKGKLNSLGGDFCDPLDDRKKLMIPMASKRGLSPVPILQHTTCRGFSPTKVASSHRRLGKTQQETERYRTKKQTSNKKNPRSRFYFLIITIHFDVSYDGMKKNIATLSSSLSLLALATIAMNLHTCIDELWTSLHLVFDSHGSLILIATFHVST